MPVINFLENLFSGAGIAMLGGVLAVIMGGYGSAKAVGNVGSVITGVLSEDPTLYGKLLVLQALPGTQGIYGLLVWFFVMLQGGFFDGTYVDMTLQTGVLYMLVCLPSIIVLNISAKNQGRVAADGCALVAKRPDESAKAIVLSAMVETYAILALLASVLGIMFI